VGSLCENASEEITFPPCRARDSLRNKRVVNNFSVVQCYDDDTVFFTLGKYIIPREFKIEYK